VKTRIQKWSGETTTTAWLSAILLVRRAGKRNLLNQTYPCSPPTPRFTSIDASIIVAEDAVVGTKVGRRLEAFDEDQDAVQFRIGPARQQAILLGSGFGNTTGPPDSTAVAIDLFDVSSGGQIAVKGAMDYEQLRTDGHIP
jgi:hypothetical protein